MFFLIRKLLGKRKKRPAGEKPAEPPRPAASPKPRPEWEKTLVASLEANNLAPSEEVILHAFDQFKDELYGPIDERRLQLNDLYSEILADIAALKALAPDLVDRAMARHPFEFAHVIEHKEVE
jgi:hypothetical protein